MKFYQFDVFKGNSNSSSVTLNSSSALQLNTWTHVALVNEEYTLKFYIDGVESGSIEWTDTGSNIDPAIPLQIGGLAIQSSSIDYLDGYMQDIRIDRPSFNVDFLPPTTLSNPICNTSQSQITLTSLKDTPVNYTNAGGKYIRVAENESKVEFVGINIAGSTNNQFSDFLSADITSDQQINDFTFGGLDLGKTYRLSSTICLNANGSSDFPKVDFYNGTDKILTLFSKGSTSTVSNSMLFIARDSNITVSGRDLSSSAYLMGDPEISFVQLELPPTIAVELEEEIFYPPSTGGGVFSIADVSSFGSIYDMASQYNNINSLVGSSEIHLGDISMYSYIDKGTTGSIKTFEEFDSSMTSFGVLNIGDMKLTANMNHTGVDDQSSNFPNTLSFDWQ